MIKQNDKEVGKPTLSEILTILAKNKKPTQYNEENLPRVIDILEQLMTTQTLLAYPEKSVMFPETKLSPIKTLQVNICSIETTKASILHQLHTKTRSV